MRRRHCVVLVVSLLVLATAWLALRSTVAPEPPAPASTAQAWVPASRPEFPWSRQSLEAGQLSKQGITGLVLDERARPVVGAEVYMLPTLRSELSRGLATQGSGHNLLARATTNALGRFRIAVAFDEPESRRDLCIVASELVDIEIRGVIVRAGAFTDVGTVRGKPGACIEGTVTAADGKPIEKARVHVAALGRAREGGLIPGREHGLCAETDALGCYRLRGAPFGSVDLFAVAPGYARHVKAMVQVPRGTSTRVDFVLTKGSLLEGLVVDTAGRVIPAAMVTVRFRHPNQHAPSSETSGPDGRFTIEVPFAAECELDIEHPGYQRLITQSLPVTSSYRRLVLHRLGAISISVRGNTGWALDDYTVTLRTEVAGSDGYATTECPPQRIHTRPGELGRLEGIVPRRERYVLQVDAKDHARGYSEPFAVELDRDPELVTVQLDTGGGIAGRVLDAAGAPLQGAKVATLPGLVPDIPDVASAVAKLPFKITPLSGKTDAEGKFHLPLLAPGLYFLRISHQEHHDLVLGEVHIAAGPARILPDIRMRHGTIVSGTVRRGGKPTPLLGITITTIEAGRNAQESFLSLIARTGADGRFRFGKHLPPGQYRVRAGELSRTDPRAPLAGASTTLQIVLDGSERERVLDLEIDGW